MKSPILRSLFALIVLAAPAAQAGLVTVDFTVTVNSASADTGVSVGDTLAGSYTYDDATVGMYTPPFSQFHPAVMDYFSAVTGFEIDINGTAFGATDGDIQYRDSVNPLFTGGDQFSVFDNNSTLYGELNPSRLLTTLSLSGDGPASVMDFGTTDPNPLLTVLPTDFPDLSIFMGFGPYQGSIYSTISGSLTVTSISPAVVPLPAAAWLFGSGLLGLLATGFRKRYPRLHTTGAPVL